jgi:hypothetical protein
MSRMDMLTDRWFLIGLAVMAGVMLLTAGLCYLLHQVNERIERYEPEYRQALENRYTDWRVFLLNVRIAAYMGKEKDGTSKPRPCSVLSFPRLPAR